MSRRVFLGLFLLASLFLTDAVGASGNRLTASEQLFASALNAQPKTINRLYTYDDVYRLTGENLSINNQPSTLNYGYDPVGNRLSRLSTINPILSTSASFDANDRLNTDTYDAKETLNKAKFSNFSLC